MLHPSARDFQGFGLPVIGTNRTATSPCLPHELSVRALDEPEVLEVRTADGDDAAAAFRELLEQRLRQRFRRGGGKDGKWKGACSRRASSTPLPMPRMTFG